MTINDDRLAYLLLISESRLDDEIRKEIFGLLVKGRWISFYRLFREFLRPADRRQWPGLPELPVPSVPGLAMMRTMRPQRRSLLHWWVDTKRDLLSFPGAKINTLVRMYTDEGGRNVCAKIDYCRRKVKVSKWTNLFRDYEEEFASGVNKAAEFMVEKAAEEGLKTAKEVIGVVQEEFTDHLFPVALGAKVFKFGLDDLCPCCPSCVGAGEKGEFKCADCRGDGLLEPFPDPSVVNLNIDQ